MHVEVARAAEEAASAASLLRHGTGRGTEW